MLYHRFTIISLFALGATFLGLLLMNESHPSRPVLLSMTAHHTSIQQTTVTQHKEVSP
jgi:hypothetical protein